MADAVRADVMLMTPDEFLVYPLSSVSAELVRGELRVTPPPGGPHGCRASHRSRIRPGVRGRCGLRVDPTPAHRSLSRASFVRFDRLPQGGIGPGFLKLVPDLAVEVLSPSESASDLEEKLDDYRACGTPLIWVVDPVRRTVMIVASDSPVRWLHETDTLDGGEVIPGFLCGVAEIFEGIAR